MIEELLRRKISLHFSQLEWWIKKMWLCYSLSNSAEIWSGLQDTHCHRSCISCFFGWHRQRGHWRTSPILWIVAYDQIIFRLSLWVGLHVLSVWFKSKIWGLSAHWSWQFFFRRRLAFVYFHSSVVMYLVFILFEIPLNLAFFVSFINKSIVVFSLICVFRSSCGNQGTFCLVQIVSLISLGLLWIFEHFMSGLNLHQRLGRFFDEILWILHYSKIQVFLEVASKCSQQQSPQTTFLIPWDVHRTTVFGHWHVQWIIGPIDVQLTPIFLYKWHKLLHLSKVPKGDTWWTWFYLRYRQMFIKIKTEI